MRQDQVSSNTQNNRIAIVTGANNGIGYETTLGLAKANYHVVMACRNMTKGAVAKTQILQNLPKAKLDVIQLDLSDLNSVKQFVKTFSNKYQKLDVLINNAGIMMNTLKKNNADIELQFATNHLGHFALTSMLINSMPNHESSRIIALSSVAHRGAKIHFDDLDCLNDKTFGAAYGQSKLACLMFADELDRRLKQSGSKIRALAAHPGVSDTGLFDEMSWVQSFMFKILGPFLSHSNAKAAMPSLQAAFSKVKGGEYIGPTGIYELKGKPGPAKKSKYSQNKLTAQKLWDLSEELCGIEFIL